MNRGFYVYFMYLDGTRDPQLICLTKEDAEKAALKMAQENLGITFKSINEMFLTFDNQHLFDRIGTVFVEEIQIQTKNKN